MKIKTLKQTWTGGWGAIPRLYLKEGGPIVDIDESDVCSVESTVDGWTPDDVLSIYLYCRNHSTVAVKYLDLKEASPELAKKAYEAYRRKCQSPDPCAGSCT